MKQTYYGRGGELLLVQDLEQDEEGIQETNGMTKEAFESHFKKNMYQYLVPSGFKKYTQEYLEESDINAIKAPVFPKPKRNMTEEEKDDKKEKQKKKREEKAVELFENNTKIDDPNITAAERDKTIQLMLKLLSRHVDDAKEEMTKMNEISSKTQAKIEALQHQLEREEMQVALDDIKRRKDQAEKELEESRAEANLIRAHRHVKLDDLMVENEVMLAEIQVYQKKRGYSRSDSRGNSSDRSSIADEDIDRFIKSAEKSKRHYKKTTKTVSFKGIQDKPKSVARPKTAASKSGQKLKNKGKMKSSKPLTSNQRKMLEQNWNPDTASAYGMKTPSKDKMSASKTHKVRDSSADNEFMKRTQSLRERSKNNRNQEELEKLDKKLNDEVSKAFDDMANILSKYE